MEQAIIVISDEEELVGNEDDNKSLDGEEEDTETAERMELIEMMGVLPEMNLEMYGLLADIDIKIFRDAARFLLAPRIDFDNVDI